MAAERVYLETLQKLWECSEENLTEVINNKLLLATDNEESITLHLVAEWGCIETLRKLWEVLKRT